MKYKLLSAIIAIFILSAFAVYAHGSQSLTGSNSFSMTQRISSFEQMDEFHDQMIKDLDPELKEQMEIMHEGCKSGFDGEETSIFREMGLM